MGPIGRVKGLAGYTENKGFPYRQPVAEQNSYRFFRFLPKPIFLANSLRTAA